MPANIDTKYFRCFESVLAVEKIECGLLVEVDSEFREFLRVDIIREDVIRLKMSRNRVFDEKPTFAVCAKLTDEKPQFTIEDTYELVRIRTAKLALTIYKQPFRIDAHRADGSIIFESYVDELGASWSYASLNDEFLVRRKCHREDAFFGLGEKSGPFNRRGRSYTLWNTDVMDPNVAGGFVRDHIPDDPKKDPVSSQ